MDLGHYISNKEKSQQFLLLNIELTYWILVHISFEEKK